MLEQFDWRGYFLVTTDWIGRPGFLMQRRSTSWTGGGTSWAATPVRIRPAWRVFRGNRCWAGMEESTERLGEIVGHPVNVASVPAATTRGRWQQPRRWPASGRYLRPSHASVQVVDGCRVLGPLRGAAGHGTEWSGGFAAGKVVPRLRQGAVVEGQASSQGRGRGTIPAGTRGYTEEGLNPWLIRPPA